MNTTALFDTFEDQRTAFLASKKASADSIVASFTDGSPVICSPTILPNTQWGFGYNRRVLSIKGERKVRSLADDLSAWNGIPLIEARALIEQVEKNKGELLDYSMLFSREPSIGSDYRYAFVDIETTGLNPEKDDILEVSIVVTDREGDTVEVFDELFNVENITLAERYGIGTDIHGITLEDIRHLPSFVKSPHVGTVARILNDPKNIMVSHNKSFETLWFSHYVPGFYEAHSRSNPDLTDSDMNLLCPEIDTQTLTFILTSSEDCRLESLVNYTGDEYVNAHRAMNDVQMMKTAYFKLKNKHKNN